MINTTFETSRGLSKLNPFLIEQKKLTQEQVDIIKNLHIEKDALFDLIESTEITDDNRGEFLAKLEDVEYRLQESWGFPRNSAYFKHWLSPKCSCPRIDNEDMHPSNYKYYNSECELHRLTNKESELS